MLEVVTALRRNGIASHCFNDRRLVEGTEPDPKRAFTPSAHVRRDTPPPARGTSFVPVANSLPVWSRTAAPT
jgi:hypothetical protein